MEALRDTLHRYRPAEHMCVVAINVLDDAVEIVAGISTGSAGVQDITITADTGAVITGVGAFEYLAEGTVSSVSPASGQYGTRVVIAGSRLRGGGSAVVSVTLAGVAVASIESQTDDEVAVIAQHSDDLGDGDVVLTADIVLT